MTVTVTPAVRVPAPDRVFVSDHTSRRIDHVALRDAVAAWNLNGRVTLVRVTDCLFRSPCAVVITSRDKEIGARSNYGYADMVAAGRWEVLLNASLQEQFYRPMSPGGLRLARAVACHELGHVLLGGHTEHGCFRSDWGGDFPQPVPGWAMHPGDFNLAALANLQAPPEKASVGTE